MHARRNRGRQRRDERVTDVAEFTPNRQPTGLALPWASFNRYQRLDDSLHPHFSDTKPSIGVPFTSSIWGTLAASNAHRWPGGNLRSVYFWPAQIKAHAVRTYHPGQ